jgi:hypothetical protein
VGWLDWFSRRRAPARGEISYSPSPNGRPDPGEVVWAWVPYEEDARQGKDRPVLLIGRAGRQLLAVPLTSQDREGRRDAIKWVEIGRGPWDRRGRESHANASRLLRYKPRQVRREGATLPRDRFDAVVARARQLHPDELG